MILQDKFIEASTEFRARAAAFAASALDVVSRVGLTTERVDELKSSLGTLTVAGRQLRKVAGRHASRLVRENSAIAVAAGKDIRTLARETYASLAGRKPVVKNRKRRTAVARKRVSAKAA